MAKSKYIRTIYQTPYADGAEVTNSSDNIDVDVYEVLEAFNVTCPARQHAIKKLLCAGIRGKGDAVQDLKETREAVFRAIQLEERRVALAKATELVDNLRGVDAHALHPDLVKSASEKLAAVPFGVPAAKRPDGVRGGQPSRKQTGGQSRKRAR